MGIAGQHGLPCAILLPGFEAFKHVRAAADDGAPDGLLRIAQTSDGYIWLAGTRSIASMARPSSGSTGRRDRAGGAPRPRR
jgi:hypothetical protein